MQIATDEINSLFANGFDLKAKWPTFGFIASMFPDVTATPF